MKPICVPCQRFFRPKKNGYYFIEAMPKAGSDHPPAGTEAADQWTPYKLWVGDKYVCDGCKTEIVVGVPREPVAEHYQPGFGDAVTRLKADQLQVNDC